MAAHEAELWWRLPYGIDEETREQRNVSRILLSLRLRPFLSATNCDVSAPARFFETVNTLIIDRKLKKILSYGAKLAVRPSRLRSSIGFDVPPKSH